jgi:hypothetical protein
MTNDQFPTLEPIQSVLPGDKAAGASHHSPPYSAENYMIWNFASMRPMLLYGAVLTRSDSFTFTFTRTKWDADKMKEK